MSNFTELVLRATAHYTNPYTDVEVWAVFRHEETGMELLRPAFWDGDSLWRVRFAAPKPGIWHGESFSTPHDSGLTGQAGTLIAEQDETASFWQIPPGKRNLTRTDGTPVLLVADTPWALPWRATHAQAEVYAADRQAKGFNAALLMSVQPDRNAIGPRDRTQRDGFEVGFEDLPSGHLNQLNPEYFQYLDGLVQILVAHGITPVWNPVFHGYGWKGLQVAGPVIPPHEYARYCRYLVARYGAQPALWLVAADGDGLAPSVDPGGKEIETWDAYAHPTGIHYAPHQHPWAHQDRDWLDFQWCQTGHNGEHVPQRVAVMHEKLPHKAVANGEPTYENIGAPGKAAGWWQGHEAWSNLTAGGTMGVVYGAGSLWQWRLDLEEEHLAWCMAEGASWREALDFEGSVYVGLLSKVFADLPFDEMQPDFRHTYGRAGLLVPGKLFLIYLSDGGTLTLARTEGIPINWRVVDPKTAEIIFTGEGHGAIPTGDGPRVVIYGEKK